MAFLIMALCTCDMFCSCCSTVALDMSPAQVFLLELKLTAIRHLSFRDYLVLLGETEDTEEQRVAVLHKIEPHLPKLAQVLLIHD